MATVKAKAKPKKGVLAKFKSKAAKGKATTAKSTASKAPAKAKTVSKAKAATKAKTVKAKVVKAKAMKAKTTKAKVAKAKTAKAKVVKAAAKPKVVAKPKDIATEIEKSGNPAMLRAAIKRLNASGKPRKELLVPGTDMDRAKKIAKEIVKGKMTIQNLGRTQRKFVR